MNLLQEESQSLIALSRVLRASSRRQIAHNRVWLSNSQMLQNRNQLHRAEAEVLRISEASLSAQKLALV